MADVSSEDVPVEAEVLEKLDDAAIVEDAAASESISSGEFENADRQRNTFVLQPFLFPIFRFSSIFVDKTVNFVNLSSATLPGNRLACPIPRTERNGLSGVGEGISHFHFTF